MFSNFFLLLHLSFDSPLRWRNSKFHETAEKENQILDNFFFLCIEIILRFGYLHLFIYAIPEIAKLSSIIISIQIYIFQWYSKIRNKE